MSNTRLDKGRNAFVSYAHEDRVVAKNLVDTLARYDVDAWWDGYEIEVGDSIRSKINEGLRSSQFGIVVLSHAFFAVNKKWTKQELAALAVLLDDGHLLPVLWNMSHDDLKVYDPLLADIKALQIDGDIRGVVAPLARKIKGGIQRDENGKLTFIGETVRISELELTPQIAIEDVVFKDCVIQGVAMLNWGDQISMSHCHLESHMFIFLDPPYAISGAIGMNRVVFDGCRFKDVGIIVNSDLKQAILGSGTSVPAGTEFPPHLN